jgi:hypothetical protein
MTTKNNLPPSDSTEANNAAGAGCMARLFRPLPEYTFEDGEGPRCPFCKTQWTADDPVYYDENGFEDECSECGNIIRIVPTISVSWTTTPIRWTDER